MHVAGLVAVLHHVASPLVVYEPAVNQSPKTHVRASKEAAHSAALPKCVVAQGEDEAQSREALPELLPLCPPASAHWTPHALTP